MVEHKSSKIVTPLVAGAKAGLGVGLFWGVAQGMIAFVFYPTHHLVSLMLTPIVFSIGGAFALCVWGVLFARVEEYFPIHSMVVKGMVFMIILWGFGHILLGAHILSAVVLGLISNTLAGAGLGYFTNKFSKKNKP